jgi:flagellar hook-associated protein 3 FlgL
MRITQNMMHTGALAKYQQNLRQIDAAQQRVGTGLRILKASDDPAGTSMVMQAGSSLRALEQYHRNVQSSRTRVDAEEASLNQLGDLLVRAKELALAQGSDTADADTRRTAQAEIKQLLHFAVQLANTQVSGSHIFGGKNAGEPPVSWLDPDIEPPSVTLDALDPGHHRAEIAAGTFLQTSSNAHDVFTTTGIFDALWNLSQALGANDGEGTRATITALDEGFGHVQSLIGDVGARATQLQVTAANLDALEINLRTLKADLEEADFEKAVTELVSRQTAFQAAMLAASRVMGMTLADYLR